MILLEQWFHKRQEAIRRRIEGESTEQIASSLKCSATWVHKWWGRYQQEGVEGLYDRPHVANNIANRTDPVIRRAVLSVRRQLQRRKTAKTRYSLIGSATIRTEMEKLGYWPLPALRTIERLLQEESLTTPREREDLAPVLREYPAPKAKDSNDVHQLDLISPRYIEGDSSKIYFVVVKDIFDKSAHIQMVTDRQAQTIVESLVEAWQLIGIPKVLQVDNGWEFQGSARWPRSFGKVICLCLRLKVELTFIPEGMAWRNGSVENLNGQFDRLFVKALKFKNQAHIRLELKVLNEAVNTQHVHEALGFKTSQQYRRGKKIKRLSPDFADHKDSSPICAGRLSFIRQVRPSGLITILHERFKVGKRFKGQFVNATIFTKQEKLKIYFRGRIVKQWSYKLRN